VSEWLKVMKFEFLNKFSTSVNYLFIVLSSFAQSDPRHCLVCCLIVFKYIIIVSYVHLGCYIDVIAVFFIIIVIIIIIIFCQFVLVTKCA